MKRFWDRHELRTAIAKSLLSEGCNSRHAFYVADTLVETSLRGVDTHGIELLPTYLRELRGGRAARRPRMAWDVTSTSTATLDAADALGVVAANVAVRKAIQMAKRSGTSAICVRNSNHFGAAGYYSAFAAERGMICFTFSNSDALVALNNGRAPVNGTNPFAFSAKGSRSDFFHLDMATSQTSYSLVRKYQLEGRKMPGGWAIDSLGNDASKSNRVVALKPLGGHKGQGLGTLVHILCSTLGGGPYDFNISHLFSEPYDAPRKIGHFFICVSVTRFVRPQIFSKRVSELLSGLRKFSGQGIETIVPGDIEKKFAMRRVKHGIPVSAPLNRLLSPYNKSRDRLP